MLNYMVTYRNTDKKPYDNILRSSVVTALGGGLMRHNTNKSISEAIMPCSAATVSKRSHNLLGVINGTSAVISDLEPEGKFCPFDR